MSNRQLGILVLLAAALALVTAGLYRAKRSGESEFAGGAPLIQGLEPSLVHKLVIKEGGKTTVTLTGDGKSYAVAEKDGYRAATKAINELILECLDIRTAERITVSRENHEALGVQENSKDAVSVSFLDGKGQPLIGLVRGKLVEQGSGAYVRLLGQDSVYRSDKPVSLRTGPLDYVAKTLIDVTEADVQQVEVKTEKGTYAIRRSEKGEIALQDIPAGKRAKQSEVENVFRAATRLSLSDLAPATKLELQWDATFTCALQSGLTYRVKLAKKDDKHYVALSADGPKVGSLQITKTESEEELKKKEAIILAVGTAAEFTPRHAQWVYEVSSWTAEKMRKPLADLVEDIPQAEAPDEISASHILISYQGATRADAKITRTKEEAKTRAGEALAKARAEGADFVALAKEYSDGPSGPNGGDLGAFGKGAMAQPFEEAAFKLKVGEISDVVETDFGFHVIKRTK